MRWIRIAIVALLCASGATVQAQAPGEWYRPSSASYRTAQTGEVVASRARASTRFISQPVEEEEWTEAPGAVYYVPPFGRGAGMGKGCGCGARPIIAPPACGCQPSGCPTCGTCGCQPNFLQKLNCSCKTHWANLQHRTHHMTASLFGKPCRYCGVNCLGCGKGPEMDFAMSPEMGMEYGGDVEDQVAPESRAAEPRVPQTRPTPARPPVEIPGPAEQAPEQLPPAGKDNAAYRSTEPRAFPSAAVPTRIAPAAWELPVNRRAF